MSLCIIPARGGSKRIPRKNIKLFNGKPMIAYSILAAQESDCFKQIIVSTDDDEIAQVAREYGADVPFMRPAELSDDFATTGEVVRYTLQQIEKQEKLLEYVCCLYATAPFVQFTKLQEGMQVLEDNSNIDFALAVTPFSFPPQRSLSINQAGFLEINNPELFAMRSQDLSVQYHDAGQFMWGTKEAWSFDFSFYKSKIYPICIPSYMVQDIDNEEDWIRAETMWYALNKVRVNNK